MSGHPQWAFLRLSFFVLAAGWMLLSCLAAARLSERTDEPFGTCFASLAWFSERLGGRPAFHWLTGWAVVWLAGFVGLLLAG